jgi:hypothetical protein
VADHRAIRVDAVVEPRDVLHDGELELRAIRPHTVGDQLGLEESTKLSARALPVAADLLAGTLQSLSTFSWALGIVVALAKL